MQGCMRGTRGRHCLLWTAAVLAALAMISVLPAQSPAPVSSAVIWIAGQQEILKLDTGTGEIAQRIPDLTGVRALAVDPVRGTLWAYGAGRLAAYAADGALLLAVAPGNDADAESARLLVDGADGGVWLAAGTRLQRFAGDGTPQFALEFAAAVTAVTLDRPRRRLWAAHAPGSLTAYDAGGAQAASLALDGIGTVDALAHDPALDALSVAGDGRLQH